MRTTIEITSEQRAELLRIAASRGEKGFSTLIQAAIDLFLNEEAERRKGIGEALRMRGTLSAAAAERMLTSVREMRNRWR